MLRPLTALRRVINVTEDLLYLAGRSLQRRAMRNGLLVLLGLGSTLLGIKVAGAEKLERQQILSLLVIAFASYPAGTVLVRLANFLTLGHLRTAAAGHLHLMSHFKQTGMREHLGALWDGVYRYEANLQRDIHNLINTRARARTVEETVRHFLARLDRPVREAMRISGEAQESALVERILSGYVHDPGVEATRELFVHSGLFALTTPMPQVMQERRVGFDLSPLEDWYEKGVFTYEDFPAKSFLRDPLVRGALAEVEPRWRFWARELLAPEPAGSLFYSFTVRKLGVLLGKSIRDLNREAGASELPDYFTAQHFLWPDEALDADVVEHWGPRGVALRERLRHARHACMEAVFSASRRDAREHVGRMFARDYRRIFATRLAYDVEYAGGSLASDPANDLGRLEADFGLRLGARSRLDATASRARASLDAARTLVERHSAEANAEELRAIAIAVHTGSVGLRSAHPGGDAAAVDRARTHTPVVSARLVRLRTHHVLVRLHLDTYLSVVEGMRH